jgi:hypothetical protein
MYTQRDSFFLDWRFCQSMLLLNALWDIISTFCIWCSFCVKDVLDQTTEEPVLVLNQDHYTNYDRKQREGQFVSAFLLPIAEMHTSLWTRKTDASNHAACMLMSWLVFTLGMIRLFAGFDQSIISLAAVSYAIEGFFLLSEALKSTMIPKQTSIASIFCFVCLFVCVLQIPH